jgi:hypothetical protein
MYFAVRKNVSRRKLLNRFKLYLMLGFRGNIVKGTRFLVCIGRLQNLLYINFESMFAA